MLVCLNTHFPPSDQILQDTKIVCDLWNECFGKNNEDIGRDMKITIKLILTGFMSH